MGIFHTIERLQRYPERSRERIAIGIASGVTAVILIIWLASFSATRERLNFGGVTYRSEDIEAPAGPLQVLGNLFYEGYEQFRGFGSFFEGFR